jgi:hypothetical protein
MYRNTMKASGPHFPSRLPTASRTLAIAERSSEV